jgi:transcriptional regulator with XRE-family HTH domain
LVEGSGLPDEVTSFSGLLRQHRLTANLTHRSLSGLSGLSVDTISMLERGVRHMPRRSTLVALAQALRLPPVERETLFAAAERRPSHEAGAPAGCPQAIVALRREAHAALAAGLPMAAAAMALRAVHRVCVDQEAVGGGNLCDRIEELGRGLALHPTFVLWAHQIRLFESTIAHALVADLDSVTRRDAAALVAFLDELLRFTYEVPDRLGRLRAGAT